MLYWIETVQINEGITWKQFYENQLTSSHFYKPNQSIRIFGKHGIIHEAGAYMDEFNVCAQEYVKHLDSYDRIQDEALKWEPLTASATFDPLEIQQLELVEWELENIANSYYSHRIKKKYILPVISKAATDTGKAADRKCMLCHKYILLKCSLKCGYGLRTFQMIANDMYTILLFSASPRYIN